MNKIEILMSMALFLYFLAFYLARHFPMERWRHIFVACMAFLYDASATYLMFLTNTETKNWILWLHSYFGLIALGLFLIQGTLGILRKRKLHIVFAKYVFLPAWVISYSSGFLLLIK